MKAGDNGLTLITLRLFLQGKSIVKHQALEQTPVVPYEARKTKYRFHFTHVLKCNNISLKEDNMMAKLYQSERKTKCCGPFLWSLHLSVVAH